MKGFDRGNILIELILGISLISIILFSLTQFLDSSLKIGKKVSDKDDLSIYLDYILEYIDSEANLADCVYIRDESPNIIFYRELEGGKTPYNYVAFLKEGNQIRRQGLNISRKANDGSLRRLVLSGNNTTIDSVETLSIRIEDHILAINILLKKGEDSKSFSRRIHLIKDIIDLREKNGG